MGLVSPPAAALVQLVAKNDYDSRAATLCGSPDAFVLALECLDKNNVTGYPSLGFICMIDPQRENFLEELFRIHLSKETRIKNLTKKG